MSKKKLSLKALNLCDYLTSLNSFTLDKLYHHPAPCLAVYRDLPSLAKHYIIRLLFVEQAIPQAVITSWVNQTAQSEHNEAVKTLQSLNIWIGCTMPGGLPGWTLNQTFRANLKIALLGGGNQWAVKATKDKYARDVEFLDSYAAERWECILHFMVGSKKITTGTDTIQTMIHGGLVKTDESSESKIPLITSDGFQFLLMDTASQVWYFILQYLETVESKGMNLIECLTFLFQLSFLTPGKAYSTESLSESLLNFLQHLREFGLAYQRKRKDGLFYPTSLVINVGSGLKDAKLDINKSGYIIVETNYNVYAYTDSPLQIALLGLFTELQYRFPNLVIGLLTRESVRQALRSGITADQIINFLSTNAHTEAGRKSSKVPPTVTDQIKLWEIERDRFLFREGVLYSQFLSQGDFELLRKYAHDAGYLIWDNSSRRVMVVSQQGHDDVRRFWKRHKKDH